MLVDPKLTSRLRYVRWCKNVKHFKDQTLQHYIN